MRVFKFGVIALTTLFGAASVAVAGPLCGLGSWSGGGQTAPASPLASQQMSRVSQVLCGQFRCPNFQFLQSNGTQNAMALSEGSGNYIVYNSGFMDGVLQRFGPQATIGILGHELGHLIDFMSNPTQVNQATREANADRYAGCAFALAGQPETELLYLAQTLHALGPSPGYPTPSQRTSLLSQGYRQCSGGR